jgi:hypothetical protein
MPPPGVIVQHLREGKLLGAYYDMRNDLDEFRTNQFLKEEFLRIWEIRKNEVVQKVETWSELPIEERIDHKKLAAMETTLRKLRRNSFSEEKRTARIKELTKQVPTFKQKLQQDIEQAREAIQREAQLEGLTFSDIQFE